MESLQNYLSRQILLLTPRTKNRLKLSSGHSPHRSIKNVRKYTYYIHSELLTHTKRSTGPHLFVRSVVLVTNGHVLPLHFQPLLRPSNLHHSSNLQNTRVETNFWNQNIILSDLLTYYVTPHFSRFHSHQTSPLVLETTMWILEPNLSTSLVKTVTVPSIYLVLPFVMSFVVFYVPDI